MNFQSFDMALETAFAWAWKTSLQATVLIALVCGVQWICKRALAPRWRYALGLLILLRLALPFAPASSISIFNLSPRFESNNPVPTRTTIISPAVSPLPAVTPDKTETFPTKKMHFPYVASVWLAGCIGMLSLAARQQRKLTLRLRNDKPITDPHMLKVLDDCKTLLGIKRSITVFATCALGTPALFGIWRPRLLIPAEMLARLDERELRLIFLHELTHLKREDVVVNWAIILVRSAHWFNPCVWFAMKRLRADQELACDAAVIARLATDDRRLYGDTLIRLVSEFSASPFCPGLVPFITKKKLIERRITMIAKFRPAGRIALIGSIAVLIALGCFTFTRAADKPATTPAAAPASAQTTPANDAKPQLEAKQHALMALQEELMELTDQVRDREQQMLAMRKGLNIPTDVAEGKASSGVDREAVRQYQTILTDSETQYVREATLLAKLKEIDPGELRDVLPTAVSDGFLGTLLEQLSKAEMNLSALRGNFGEQHPDVKMAAKTVDDLEKQINARVKGIMKGLEVKVDSLKAAVEQAKSKLEAARKEDSVSADSFQDYFRAKRDLETLQKSRDALFTRLNDAKIELNLQAAQQRQ